MRLSLPPISASPTSEDVSHAVSLWRAELEASHDVTQRALLHYELALLFERARDDNGAAKELLLAVNALSTLHEPLEHLIALIERRKSYANLGKLLDRLGRIAETPREMARAQMARGDFLTDHRTNFALAVEAYEQVIKQFPDHRLAWLSLHYLGARQSDAKLVENAWNARIAHATHKGYRDSLRLQLARFQALRGRQDLARATLEAAASPHSPVLYPALLQLEQLIKTEDHAARAKVLEQQAELLALGLVDAGYAAAHGIPTVHRQRSTVADISLRVALNLALSRGAPSRIGQALGRAFDAGADPLLVARIAREGGALQLTEHGLPALGLAELPPGEEISAAQHVEQALQPTLKPHDGSLALLTRALADDPNSVTARALQLEVLWARRAFADLAQTYEEMAQHLTGDGARQRTASLAAICWSFSDEPSERARAALNLVEASGPSPGVAQLGSVLAGMRGDELWRREALLEVLSGANGSHHASPLLELILRALQRRDFSEARLRLQALSGVESAACLAWLLEAFVPAFTQGVSDGPLRRTSAAESLAHRAPPAARTALLQWAAFARARTGDGAAQRDLLLGLHAEQPENLAVVLQLVPALLALDDADLAVRVLTHSAGAVADEAARSTLHLYAGLVAWSADARDTAVRCFEAGAGLSNPAPAATQLLHWALRAASPDDATARRRLLSEVNAGVSDEDRAVHALERFALEVGFGNQKSAATAALDGADELSLDEVGEAIQLARALWVDCKHHDEALRHLQSQGDFAKELAACGAYYAARAAVSPDSEELLTRVRSWAHLGSPAAALEWLGVVSTMGDAQAEAEALRSIASHTFGETRGELRAAAALLEGYSGSSVEPSETKSSAERLVAADACGPTTNPNERARALSRVAEDWGESHPEQTLTVNLLAAYNYLASEDFDLAAPLFRSVLEGDAEEVAAWEGLAECARVLGDQRELAAALEQLGQLHSSTSVAAAALREAADCYLDELGEENLGWETLQRSVELDIANTRAFERLFRHVRGSGDHERVIELCTRRLQVADSAKEITRLHWERARAERSVGSLNDALSDLGNVRMLDPNHVGARALASEIYISIESYGRAAAELSELAGLSNAPPEQRRLSAMTAIDLFDAKLDDLDGALKTFALVRDLPDNLQPIIERLVAACARHQRWEDAVALLEDLQTHSRTSGERAEAARLELAILRDELEQPERAYRSADTLLTETPGDPEAVDLVLDGAFTEVETTTLLGRHLGGILSYAASEMDVDAAARLARVAEELDHLDLRLLSLSTLVLTGNATPEVLGELEQLLVHCAPYPEMVIPRETLEELSSPNDSGPLLEISKTLSPFIPELLGPSLRTLGLGRKERKAAHDAIAVRSEVSAWTGALSIGDVEVYVANRGGYEVVGLADDKQPSIVIASEAHALDVRDRGLIAAWLLGMSRGTSICLQRPPTEVAALLVAACRVGGAAPDVPSFALTAEFERLLARELPRRTRKALEPLAGRVVAERQDPLVFARGARETLNRIAAVACGDFSRVILTETERTSDGRNLDGHRQEQTDSLLRFCLSSTYLQIREQLGLSAR